MLFWLGLALWFSSSIALLIRRGRRGLIRFGLKEVLEITVRIWGFVFAILLFLLGTMLMPGLLDYLSSMSGYSWLSGVLVATYIFGLLFLTLFLVWKVSLWSPKYSEKEQGLILEDKIRFRKSLGRFGKYYRIKEIDGSSH